MNMRWQPSLKIIPHYESDPLYIDALVNSINNKIRKDKLETRFNISFVSWNSKKIF